MKPLVIWMASAEVAPLAQTGGLADVLRALPRALARRGHRVRVFVPAYGTIDRRPFRYEPDEDHLAVPVGIGRVPVRLLSRTTADGVRLTLVESEEMFARAGFYGPPGGDYPDNARRFATLAATVATLAARAARPPDILHGHDWHAALLPLLARFAVGWRGRRPATVQTIHNMGYQGHFGWEEIAWVAPPGPVRDHVFRTEGIEYRGGINYLKAALLYADRITAVSPRYAWEITTSEGGFGLHDVAWRRGTALSGILNGADYERWDPARDPHIPERYDAATLARKEAARRALRAAFGLGGVTAGGRAAPGAKRRGASREAASPAGAPPAPSRGGGAGPVDRPILGVVSRLVDQKGIDLVIEASPMLMHAGCDLVVLGSGDRRIVDGLENLRRIHPDRVGVYIGFNEPLSHLVVAGSDLLLVPSRYEPCGLVQMHAMRYGTLPVVHRTGGLADTVRDADEHPGRGTGFVFDHLDAGSLAHAVHRGMILRAREPGALAAMQQRAMAEDFSWESAAARYEALYAGLTA
jgi:starch synthase